MNVIYFLAFASSLIISSEALTGYMIARQADSHVGETKWSNASDYKVGAGESKCNIFIDDVFKELGVNVPTRRPWYWPRYRGIGAGEWGNPSSTFLIDDSCWSSKNTPELGDVIGDGSHVAFYTDYQTATSAGTYRILKNDWGFRSGQRISAIWRYTC